MSKTKEKEKTEDKSITNMIKKCTVNAKYIMEEKQKEVISISPAIDYVLGGGIESGSLCLITGQEKLGKTSACLHMAKKLQQAGYKIVYCNVEMRLSKRDLQSAIGLELDDDKLRVFQSTEEQILSGNDYLRMVDRVISTEQRVAVFVDSFSQLISQDNMDGDIGEMSRDSMPLILSKFCKRVLPYISIHGNICVGITHEVANTSGWGKSTVETSGRKLQYANNFKLKADKKYAWMDDDKQIGQLIDWKCENSAICEPNKVSKGYLRYNHGIDEEYELLAVARTVRAITINGAWYQFGETKVQGEDGAIAYLREHPDEFAKLYQEVRSRVGS